MLITLGLLLRPLAKSPLTAHTVRLSDCRQRDTPVHAKTCSYEITSERNALYCAQTSVHTSLRSHNMVSSCNYISLSSSLEGAGELSPRVHALYLLLVLFLEDRRAVFGSTDGSFVVRDLCPDSRFADIVGASYGCNSVRCLMLETLRESVWICVLATASL